MSFLEMNTADWEAVRQHHDALIHMAELELEADTIRKTHAANEQELLQPLQAEMHKLDTVIANLPA